ncbi:MAG: hypothetical protein K2X86_04945 [Cytophagaceae bacterium]|nr:hypothetical protein [Cytophagaceae bacterium]
MGQIKTPQQTADYYCELAIKYATGFGKELNYSEESIKDVEGILGYYSEDLHPGFFKKIMRGILKENPSDAQISSMAIVWGSYIGEVFKRHAGASCEWAVENVFGEGEILHLKAGDSRLFPIEKAYKRLVNGTEDNVWSFYTVFKEKIKETV